VEAAKVSPLFWAVVALLAYGVACAVVISGLNRMFKEPRR